MNIDALREIMLSIAEARSLNPILKSIVEGITENSDVALVRVWLLETNRECEVCKNGDANDPAESALHLVASAGSSKVTGAEYSSTLGDSHRIPLGSRKIGKIALDGKPLVIPVVTPDQDWVANPQWIHAEQVQSFAGYPLVVRGETLGVLAVFSRAKLTAGEFEWLQTFAAHAAVAIWNARAFTKLSELTSRLELQNEYLHEEVKEALHFGAIIGRSEPLQKVLSQISLVADSDATVLIEGESGTGKELVARAIHDQGKRRDRPFIRVNCGAIPEQLFESEFFGHVKGAFTGAIKDRIGRFELAGSGDVFLDEVGEIPLGLQAKLLRVLQEKQFERVGETRTRSVDARIIAATNRDLKHEVNEGRFREDLYYRLSVFPLEIPPLRARKEDIADLAAHFVKKSAARMRIPVPKLSSSQLKQLELYDWPGNIRELENVVERAMILSRQSGLLRFELPKETGRLARRHISPPDSAGSDMPRRGVLTRDQLKQQERNNILAAISKANGKIFGAGGAAEILGMRPTTLASRMKSLGIKKQFVSE